MKSCFICRSFSMSKLGTKVCTGEFTVTNLKGLHARPATELIRFIANFKSQVTFSYQDLHVSGKSLLGLLMLAVSCGSQVSVKAEGEDAEELIKAVVDLALNEFYVKY